MSKKVSLGKISVCPKGVYSSTENYTRLDLVAYLGVGWICRKNCIGIEPNEGEYWQRLGISGDGITVDELLSSTSTNPIQNKTVKKALEEKSDKWHNHNYAGSSSSGGSANSAVKLDTANVGSSTNPVYFSGGKPVPCSNILIKVQDNLVSSSASDCLSAKQGKVLKELVDSKLNTSLKGIANGLAELDSSGKVPSSQLPSYVDSIVEGYFYNNKFYTDSTHNLEIVGETGKIYMDITDNNNNIYRWSGSTYIAINDLSLGETSTTAYRGDRGKIAYSHSQSSHARTDATKVEKSTTNGNIKINGTETTVYTHPSGTNPHGTTKSDVGLGNVPNVTTNDQTTTYTEATTLAKLTSGEKLSVAFGKISKAITDLISHLGDSVKHITSTERTNWNSAKNHADSAHAPSNAQANVIESVKVNGTALTPSSKAVNVAVPTKVSQLTNDSGYKTTDTWRGIQNNLTSDSTSDSLSAAQGKVLKGLIDGKVNAVAGMTLSHNDFTDDYKNTIDNLSILNDDITVYFSSEKICQGIYDNPNSDGTKENPYISIANFTKYTNIPRNLNGHTLTLRFKPNENFSGFNENIGTGLYGGVESLNEFYNGTIYIAKDQDSKGCISFSYAYFKDIRCALVIDCSDDMKDSSITKVGIKFKSLELKDCKDVRIYPNSGDQGLLNISGLFSSYNSKVTVYWIWLQASQIKAESGSIISIGGYVSLSGTGTQRLNASSSIIMIREISSTLIDGTSVNNASTNWSTSYGGRIYIGSQTNLGNY